MPCLDISTSAYLWCPNGLGAFYGLCQMQPKKKTSFTRRNLAWIRMVLSTTKLCCTSYIKAMLPTSYNKLCFSSFCCSNSANVLVIWVISKPSPNCVHENPDVSHEYLFWYVDQGLFRNGAHLQICNGHGKPDENPS